MNGHHESLQRLLCAATGILLGPANRRLLKNEQHGMISKKEMNFSHFLFASRCSVAETPELPDIGRGGYE